MKDMMDAALEYYRQGYGVVPCNGKVPEIKWKEVHGFRLMPIDIKLYEKNHGWKNVALVCGYASYGIVVIDLDGHDAITLYREHWSHLLNTRIVATGSGNGEHVYYRVREGRPSSHKVSLETGGMIEFRANGSLVIAPPSIHPETGNRYKIINPDPVMEVPNLEPILTWMKFLQPQDVLPSPQPPNSQDKPTKKEAWAAAALEREAHSVLTTIPDSRNNSLNRSAFKLGQLVGSGMLLRAQVEYTLFVAAQSIGIGEQEALRTIKRGLEAGMSKPRGNNG